MAVPKPYAVQSVIALIVCQRREQKGGKGIAGKISDPEFNRRIKQTSGQKQKKRPKRFSHIIGGPSLVGDSLEIHFDHPVSELLEIDRIGVAADGVADAVDLGAIERHIGLLAAVTRR